jgi:hypothetical protein
MVTFLGGLFVTVVLFLATMKIMHTWATPWGGRVTTQFDRRAIKFEANCA